MLNAPCDGAFQIAFSVDHWRRGLNTGSGDQDLEDYFETRQIGSPALLGEGHGRAPVSHGTSSKRATPVVNLKKNEKKKKKKKKTVLQQTLMA